MLKRRRRLLPPPATALSVAPCSLCGANAINQDCLRCELRIELFAELPAHKQTELRKADVARGITKSSEAAANLIRRNRGFETLGRPPRIGLVGCGKRKLRDRAPARDMYTGCLFRAALEHSERYCDETYILSAAHGLLHLNTIVLPYDRSMIELNTARRQEWGQRVVAALAPLFTMMRVNFDVFAGMLYAEPLIVAVHQNGWPWTFNEPLEGLMIGERLRWFKEARSTWNAPQNAHL